MSGETDDNHDDDDINDDRDDNDNDLEMYLSRALRWVGRAFEWEV